MNYKVIRENGTVYRDCVSYHEACSALDTLQWSFRQNGAIRESSDYLKVGHIIPTICQEYRIVRMD